MGLLFCWLCLVGFVGYKTGRGPVEDAESATKCEHVIDNVDVIESGVVDAVVADSEGSLCDGYAGRTADAKAGLSYRELRQQWECAWVHANPTQVHQNVPIKNGGKSKTKWKSILTMDPKDFATKYMPQYPRDTAINEPVVVFSHKPLKSIAELSDVCKVLDVAVIPDSPGTCVSVTETFHDVASYHMLHAERTSKGDFVLAANAVHERHVPSDKDYANARGLLLQYFEGRVAMEAAVKKLPVLTTRKKTLMADFIGCVVESLDELELFRNSLMHAKRLGVEATRFALFTTNGNVKSTASDLGVKLIFLPAITSVGSQLEVETSAIKQTLRSAFLRAWFAFAVAERGARVLWQSPGTVWLGRPDNLLTASESSLEVKWAYKGHGDARAAPLYTSFDFFYASKEDRATHLLHEILLHFDLVVAWASLDTTAAYRLSENNSRYGTTSALFAPDEVLHVDAMARGAQRIKDAAAAPVTERPSAIVFPVEGHTVEECRQLLKDSGLWLL